MATSAEHFELDQGYQHGPEFITEPVAMGEVGQARVRDEVGSNRLSRGALVAIVGAGVGLVAKGFGLLPEVGIDVEHQLTVDEVSAALTSVTPIREQCWLEYGTLVSASAEYKMKPKAHAGPLSVPLPDVKFAQHMKDAAFGNKVCNKEAALKVEAGTDGKVHIKFADNTDFNVTVFNKSPMKDIFTDDPNYIAGNLGAVESIIQGLPLPEGMTPEGVDNVDEALQAAAVVIGSEASAKVCGPVAWNAAGPIIIPEIVDSVYGDYEQISAANGVTTLLPKANFVVDFPTEPNFGSQYVGLSEKLEDTKGMTVTLPDLDELTCDKTALTGAGAAS